MEGNQRRQMSNQTLPDGGPAPTRLHQYQGAQVSVYYNNQSGYVDSGQLTYMDEHFIELTKENSERLLIPIYSIRLIKLLKAAKVQDDSNILLRPVETHSEQKAILR